MGFLVLSLISKLNASKENIKKLYDINSISEHAFNLLHCRNSINFTHLKFLRFFDDRKIKFNSNETYESSHIY